MTEVALFLVLLFGFSWPWGVLVTPAAMPHGQLAFLAAFLPVVWSPTLIALGITRYTEGAAAVRRELRARLRIPRGWALLFMAGATPLLVGALAIGVARAAGDSAPFIPSTALPISIGIQIITGSTGEELGWRGFLLPRLRARIGSPGAAVVMGLLWASWHVPAFYTPGMPHRFMPMWPMLLLIALFGGFSLRSSIAPAILCCRRWPRTFRSTSSWGSAASTWRPSPSGSRWLPSPLRSPLPP